MESKDYKLRDVYIELKKGSDDSWNQDRQEKISREARDGLFSNVLALLIVVGLLFFLLVKAFSNARYLGKTLISSGSLD